MGGHLHESPPILSLFREPLKIIPTQPLHAAAVKASERLLASPNVTAQWVGRDALRELCSRSVTSRLAARYPRELLR